MKDVQASSLPPDVKADYLDHAAIDLGWQHNVSGKPVVAWPLGTLGTEEPLTWVKLGKADCYSAFVKLGRGMGGSSRPSRIMAHQKACPSYKQKPIVVHGYVFWRPKACPHSLWTKVPWSNVFKLYLLCWCLFANCYPDPNQHFGFCLLAFEVWSSSTGSKASLSQCWSPWRVWHRRGWVAWGLNSEHCKGMPHGSIWWMHCSLAAIDFICCSLNIYFCRWLRFVTSVPGKTM